MKNVLKIWKRENPLEAMGTTKSQGNCRLDLFEYVQRYWKRIITGYTSAQLSRKRGQELRKCRKYNRYVKSYRVTVEHAISQLKSYRAISSVWRSS
jgi:hypothetical protein